MSPLPLQLERKSQSKVYKLDSRQVLEVNLLLKFTVGFMTARQLSSKRFVQGAESTAILSIASESNLDLNWMLYSMMNLIRVQFPSSLTQHGAWCELSLDYPSAVKTGQGAQFRWVHVGKTRWERQCVCVRLSVCLLLKMPFHVYMWLLMCLRALHKYCHSATRPARKILGPIMKSHFGNLS